MIMFITGASGTGKTTMMFEQIKNVRAAGKDVCAIVPEQYSNDFDKKLYFYVGAETFNSLQSLTFSSVARQLFQSYGDPNRDGEYADEIARMIIIHQAIAAAKSNPETLTFFSKRSSQNGFSDEVLKIITDLRHSAITSEDLFRISLSLKDKLQDKTADIASIYCEYERLMKEYGFKDNFDDIREAAKVAALNGFFRGKCVFIDEFENFNAEQIEMLKVIFSSADDVFITLRTGDISGKRITADVSADRYTLFEVVNDTFRQLVSLCADCGADYDVKNCGKSVRFRSEDLRYLSERFMRNLPDEPENAPEVQNLRIFQARDVYSESEYVCAEIKRLVNQNGGQLRYRDIAIISNSIEEYAEIMETYFSRYDIPYFMSIERPVNHTPIIVFFLTVLDIISATKLRSEHIFRLLKCYMLGFSSTDISILENFCYKWNIDGDVWREDFISKDEDIGLINEMREKIIFPLVSLRRKIRKSTYVQEYCLLLYNYLVECGAEQETAKSIGDLIQQGKEYEASELKRIWGYLMDMIDGIAETVGSREMAFSDVSRMMRSIIGKLKYSVPPQTLDTVMVASARTARLNSPKVIFVIGATDGDFPCNVSQYGLLSENDRETLIKDYGLRISRPVSELFSLERFVVYKSVTTASDRLYITYPVAAADGETKHPAPLIGHIRAMFREDRPFEKNESSGYTEDRSRLFMTDDMITPDFYAVTLRTAYHHYMHGKDHGKNRMSPVVSSIEKVLTENDSYRERIETLSKSDGLRPLIEVKRETIERLGNFSRFVVSATGIEEYSKCPFMFFCDKLLRLKSPEVIDVDNLISGNIAHRCFENIINKGKDYFVGLNDEEIRQEVYSQADSYRASELGGNFAKTSRFDFFFGKIKEELVSSFVHERDALGRSDFTPSDVELKIDFKNSPRIRLDNGDTVIFTGFVDRVDVLEKDGKKYVRIIDYKSEQKEIKPELIANGVNIQALLYMFVIVDGEMNYKDFIPAGVLYVPFRISEIETGSSARTERDEEAFNEKMKAKGILLNDADSLGAMEKGGGEIFVSLENVVSGADMEKLKEFVYEIVEDAVKAVHDGEIEPRPLKNPDACGYCKFGDICGNRDENQNGGSKERKERLTGLLGDKKGDGE